MIRALCRGLTAAAAAFLSLAAAGSVAAASLEPYQMVRSLQLVQDSIAGGDHAALPMQRKLLEVIDQRLRTASPAEFENPRNFRALLVYGMSGGNPATVKAVLSRLPSEVAAGPAAAGIVNYLEGNTKAAMDALASIDPMKEPGEINAFLALVMGTVIGSQDAAAGLRHLDKARLLGPGTLVEEAALRRSIALSVTLRDPERFLRASNQYARRFLRSPYATQFAESFVAGVTALFDNLDRAAVVETISEMTPDHQEAIYLRLARAAMIDGPAGLGQFASEKAAELASGGKVEAADPRAALYSSIATIRSDTVEDVAARLKAIDRDKLSEGDRRLLDAALAVATEVLSPPEWAPPSDRPAAVVPGEEPGGSANAREEDPVEALVDDARQRLESIDKLLMETGG